MAASGLVHVVAAVACGCAVALVRPAGAGEAAAPLQVSLRGTLMLPDVAPAADGGEVRITGLSGIAWMGDDRYVAIMDNSDIAVLFRLLLSRTGEPVDARDLSIVRLAERHDFEDVAVCPEPLAARIAIRRAREGSAAAPRAILTCEEDTPAIRAIDLDSGRLLGVVPIPANLRERRSNRGLESLAVDPDGRHIWTANEEALPADGPPTTTERGTVVRLTRIAVPAPGERPDDPRQFAYAVDPPHRFIRVFPGDPLSGVAALTALGRDRLLVLERSGAPGLPPFANRIYLVDLGGAPDAAAVPGDLANRPDLIVAKQRLWSDTLGFNLEGLCLGPDVTAGGRSLLAIADNGGIGTPNQLVALVLEDPTRPQRRPAVDATTGSPRRAPARLTSP